ncbi:MAG TPA: lysophospholipid acyltransferase family protein, partial [Gemmatimonadales bacterium]|nr:lysophospholipid acyltransferase family protein [Gemmatimonadales bacterium]
RIDVRGAEHWERSRRGDRPIVYLMWHDALLPLLWHHRDLGVAIVVSDARAGQYLADFATALGYRAVRGSSRRGGVRALVGALKVLETGGSVAFTPDGPTGPRRVLKPGFLVAAQKSGALVVPVHADARFARRLRSWDRFLLPLPGARIRVVFGAPFEVTCGPVGLEDGRRRATEALAALVEEAAG